MRLRGFRTKPLPRKTHLLFVGGPSRHDRDAAEHSSLKVSLNRPAPKNFKENGGKKAGRSTVTCAPE